MASAKEEATVKKAGGGAGRQFPTLLWLTTSVGPRTLRFVTTRPAVRYSRHLEGGGASLLVISGRALPYHLCARAMQHSRAVCRAATLFRRHSPLRAAHLLLTLRGTR